MDGCCNPRKSKGHILSCPGKQQTKHGFPSRWTMKALGESRRPSSSNLEINRFACRHRLEVLAIKYWVWWILCNNSPLVIFPKSKVFKAQVIGFSSIIKGLMKTSENILSCFSSSEFEKDDDNDESTGAV